MDEHRADIERRVQHRVNGVVLRRLKRMVAEARADMAREDAAVRWLVPALVLLTLPYLLYLLLALT